MCCFIGACRDEEEVYNPIYPIDAPEGSVKLDLRKYYYGRTLLGWSDVYIDYENKFKTVSGQSVIYEVGNDRTTLLMEPKMKRGEHFAMGDSVMPGYFYQIFRKEDFSRYATAVRIGSKYMNMHVDTWLYENGKIIGAKVTYVECVAKDKYLDTCFQNLTIYSPKSKDEDYRIVKIPVPDSVYIRSSGRETTGSHIYTQQINNFLNAYMYGPVEGFMDLAIHHNGCFTVRRVRVEHDPE
ncbi:MAG: DUF5036 family protein [Duncaniella sp.]|nr:DUF5036 family protein [Duncaniella sp.]